MLYNHNAANGLLACMISDTSLANSKKYPLDKSDFSECQLHSILYTTLHNLNIKQCKVATIVDIDSYIKPWTAKYNVFIDNGGIDYINTIMQLGDMENFEYYYNCVRKMSCLRDIKNDGDDLSNFWDELKSDEDNYAKLDQYTLEDIINYYDTKIMKRHRKYFVDKDDDTTRKKAGDNGYKILQSFKESPKIGLSFESKYLTTLWDGFLKKNLYIRSGDTSSGKSRSVIGDLGCICANEIYDIDNNKWVENPNGNNKGLYIGCEMPLDEQVDPMMWAYISGVETSTITKGRLTDETERRVKKAIDVINDDSIWLTDMPTFNIKKIEEEVAFYKKEFNIEYLGFDYLLINNALTKEFVENRGKSTSARGDEILVQLSSELKNICKKYDIGIITATQVNADIKDYKMRDYQVLRGGKSISDKADCGSISMPITPQELTLVEPFLARHVGEYDPKNLFVETVYKSRDSEYPKECKIFSDYNLGNMRRKELFVTDKNFKPINIKKTEIVVNRC